MEAVNETILIIEDDAGINELISEKVRECCCATTSVFSGIQAFDWLKKNKAFLIMLDYSLPDMKGKEFIELLKNEIELLPPFIVATGQGDERIAVEMMKLGARDYIVKDSNFLEKIPLVISKVTNEIKNEEKLKQVENALKESENKYRKLVENSPDAIAIYTEKGIVFVNNESIRLVGAASASELLGRNVLEFVHPDSREFIIPRMNSALYEGVMLPVAEERFLRLDGSGCDVEVKAIPMIFENEQAVQIIVRDITDRKLAQEALRNSEEKFKKAFMTSPDPININRLDDGMYVSINKGFTKILGYTEEDVLGKTSIEINIWVNPADRKKLVEGLTEKGVVENLVAQFKAKNGETVYGMMSAAVIELNGVQHIMSITRDITEIKQTEEKLKKSEILHRTILQTAMNGFWITDMSGKILDVNESYSRMSGYSVQELLTMNISDVEVNESSSDIQAHIARIKENNFDRFESKHRRKDGSIYDVEISIQYKEVENEMLVAFIRDITDRKLAEKSMNDSRNNLKKMLYESSELIISKQKDVDYSMFTNTILEISGAKFAAFNLFETNGLDYTTVGFSGLSDFQAKSKKYLGFNFLNKKWTHDPIRAEKIKNNIVTKFNSLYDLNSHIISRTIATLIEKTFNLGELVVVKISKNENQKGDFTLNFKKGETLQNQELVELYATQVALFIDRRESEDTLKESERKYRVLFAESPQPMLVYDLETLDFIEVNQTAIDFYGYSHNEFLSMSIAELHQKGEREYFLKMIDLTKKGEITDGVFRHIKKNGENLFVETHSMPTPIFGKNARNILIQDVTQRKLDEDAIKSSLSLLNATLESTADGILVVDSEGRATIYNQKFVKMWNIPVDLLTERVDEQMLRYVLTQIDNPEEFQAKVNYLYKQPELSSTDEFELTDGRIFKRFSIPQKIGDKIVGRVWSFRDITERIKGEKALKEKMEEMMRFQKLTVGRELAMIELKKEINKLLDNNGLEEKYKIVQ